LIRCVCLALLIISILVLDVAGIVVQDLDSSILPNLSAFFSKTGVMTPPCIYDRYDVAYDDDDGISGRFERRNNRSDGWYLGILMYRREVGCRRASVNLLVLAWPS